MRTIFVVQCNVLASGGYSKWCRVKIYEVGKAHLGIVPRIVFDLSRPLRKPHNPHLNHYVHRQQGGGVNAGWGSRGVRP